jgi:L-aminopeptidase/D-esterase-like protein
VIAGSTAPIAEPAFPTPEPFEEGRTNTTLVVVVTDAVLDKPSCFLMAQSAHDGFARALQPAHTRFDGDIAFAVATGAAASASAPSLDRLCLAAADMVAAAIRNSVRDS